MLVAVALLVRYKQQAVNSRVLWKLPVLWETLRICTQDLTLAG
ncbi:Uncharacterised protein [Escherichia coli]|nr:Uncharacterised protein [Escherichia coli]